eukprot:GEMP01059861.1.p1 GENE.GEMP01059861.1~~GEMP01059861.1.p1  ORF type:complete len:100 (-),score=0.76 GEMP01059861.1:902-1201(-)
MIAPFCAHKKKAFHELNRSFCFSPDASTNIRMLQTNVSCFPFLKQSRFLKHATFFKTIAFFCLNATFLKHAQSDLFCCTTETNFMLWDTRIPLVERQSV